MASLMPPGKQQYFNPTTGRPLVGGQLFTYAAGTSTPKTTWQDAAGTIPNTNPITLDSTGSALVYWDGSYKIVLKDALGNTIYTVDGYTDVLSTLKRSSGSSLIGFIQDVAGAIARWVQDKLREQVSVKDFDAKGDGATSDTAAIQAALNSFGANGGVLLVPNGTYLCSSSLSIPKNVTIRGTGKISSVLQFSHTGNGLTSTWPINSSTAANIGVRNIGIACTNAANTGGGFVDVGGSFIDLFNVKFSGWKYDAILDQSEIATIDRCELFQAAYNAAGVWLVNGPDHTAGANKNYTNRITITRCQFNCAAGAGQNILDDGGGSHSYRDNNFNGGATALRACGVYGLVFSGNESEGHSQDDVMLCDTSSTGTYYGPCNGFDISGNELISWHVGRNVTVQNAVGGSITDNVFGQAVAGGAAINFINGDANNATGVRIAGNYKLISGPGITDAPFVNGFSSVLRRQIMQQTACTYIALATAAGTVTIQPASMEFINVGTRLRIVNPDGTSGESTIVTKTTANSFTCVLTSTKAALAQVFGATTADQEEGVWTPTLGATTTDGVNTYSIQQGHFSRRGNLVHARGEISISAKDAAMLGTLQIKGIPFRAENEANVSAYASIALYDGFTLAGGYTHLSAIMSPDTATIDLRKCGNGLPIAVVPATDVPGATLNLFFDITFSTSSL
jgi:hypothetical protein